MKARRWVRAVAGISVLAAASVGLLATGATGATDPSAQFDKLKPIKAPSPCKNDTGVSDDTIKVGTIVPTSGTFALFYSQTLDGIKARIAQANAEGELGKRKIELVNVDDAGDAARNTTAAQQLAEQDKVFGIITESNAGDASGAYLNSQKIPVVGWQLGLPVYGTYTNYFGMQNANTKNIKNEFTSRNADVIKELGGTKLAIIGSNAANSVVFTEQVKSAANKTKGLKTAYINHDIPVGTTEFGSVADQIKQSGADSLYTALDNAGNTGLMQALKQAGVTLKPVIFPGGYSPLVLNLPTYDDVYFGIEFKPFELAATKSWKGYDDFKKWMTSESPNVPLAQVSAVGWLSANTFIEGLKAAGVSCPTRKAFINNLRLEKGYTGNGFFDDPETTIDFAKVYGKPFQCVYYVHVENKQFVPQFDGKPFCAKQLITDNKITQVAGSAAATTTTAPPTTAAP
ncbi:MAG TPA: ABC transporter substrate-binding protein [Acidimicrobiia bacterium]|jgi:ABC-type branched-subunit amino acid transport system substrate-binding protein